MSTRALEIVNRLESLFTFVIDEVSSNEEGLVIVRSDISDAKGALLFMKELEKITDSRFGLYDKVKILRPLVYHKHWICQHSICQKNEKTKYAAFCKASVEILIKRVNKDTVLEDKFLKLENPLPCIIKLYLVHTHHDNIDETLGSVIREDNELLAELKKSAPRRDQVLCHSDKLYKLSTEEECTDGMYPTKLGNNTVLDIEAKISKRKQSTSHVFQTVKKQKVEIIPLEDNINADENFLVVQDQFSYIQLTDHLDQVQKPNSSWTVSFCQDYVICVKWDAAYFNEWKVVVCQDLTAKVFLRNEEVSSLGIKIHSVENLSSLLLAIDGLNI